MSFPDPSVSTPTLSSWQFQYGGLTIGGFSGAYQLIQASGLGLDGIRAGDAARPRDQGELAGLNLLAGRDVTVTLGVTTDGTSLAHAETALATACVPTVLTETPLYVQRPGRPLLVCMARNTKQSYGVDSNLVAMGLQQTDLQFHATDPRWYTAPTTATGPIASGGNASLDNVGNLEMRPVLVITGPCTRPSITNATLGATLTFTDPSSPAGGDLLAGDTLTIDLDLHSVTKFTSVGGTTTTVPNWIVTGSVWWNLIPGSNTIDFATSASAAGCGLTVKWSSAWIAV